MAEWNKHLTRVLRPRYLPWGTQGNLSHPESSEKSKTEGQTVTFPSGYKEGPTPQGWGGGRTDLEPIRPCSGGHDTGTAGSTPVSWELRQLSLPRACFAAASKKNLSTCFHHKHLTTACRDVFLEETWQDMHHLPPGEQLVTFPLVPALQLPPPGLGLKHKQDTSRTTGGTTIQQSRSSLISHHVGNWI